MRRRRLPGGRKRTMAANRSIVAVECEGAERHAPTNQFPGWKVKRGGGSRGDAAQLPGMPREFLTESLGSSTKSYSGADGLGTRTEGDGWARSDLRRGAQPDRDIGIRMASRALTFHQRFDRASRQRVVQARFRVTVRTNGGRGAVGSAIKAMVISIDQLVVDNYSTSCCQVVERVRKVEWRKRGLKEGWQRVTRAAWRQAS